MRPRVGDEYCRRFMLANQHSKTVSNITGAVHFSLRSGHFIHQL